MYDFRRDNEGAPGYQLLMWWSSLAHNLDDRARLRRASCSDEVASIPSFYRLVQLMGAKSESEHELLSRVAIVASHVTALKREHSFGAQLAEPSKRGKPFYSDLRMRYLLSSREEELVARFTRAIRHARGTCNLLDVANALVDWDEARRRWARNYWAQKTPEGEEQQ